MLIKGLTMRTAKTMQESFITKPGDIFTVKGSKNCISSSITVEVANKGNNELFNITLSNTLPAWQMLLKLDNMGGRSVFNQHGDDAPIPFKESMSYKHRFIN